MEIHQDTQCSIALCTDILKYPYWLVRFFVTDTLAKFSV